MKTIGRSLLVCFGLFLLWSAFSSPLSPYAARSLKQCWQYGHIALFAVWSYLLLSSSLRKLKPASLFSLLMLAGLVCGLAIEALQIAIGREFSLEDLLLDLLGCLLGASLATSRGLIRLPARARNSLYLFTTASLLLAVLPLFPILLDEANMHRKFPLLADFSSTLELKRWKGDVDIIQLDNKGSPQNVLKVAINTSRYSGTSLLHFMRDWQGYKRLRLQVYNPDSDALKLTLRIHDDSHFGRGRGDYYDRFNRQLSIKPGWNSINIDLADVAAAPRGRGMDMGRIQGLGLFTVESPRHRHIFISNLRLSD